MGGSFLFESSTLWPCSPELPSPPPDSPPHLAQTHKLRSNQIARAGSCQKGTSLHHASQYTEKQEKGRKEVRHSATLKQALITRRRLISHSTQATAVSSMYSECEVYILYASQCISVSDTRGECETCCALPVTPYKKQIHFVPSFVARCFC